MERLVWAGARGGTAHRRRPLSLVADTCAFRPAVLAALRRDGLEWRLVFENGGREATAATVQADLAVSAWLGLPDFAVNLFQSGIASGPRRSWRITSGAG